ncbi:hypothetical protein CONLIGDRAFT_688327 [Coniochaeta ligniaria NRRL 30616]|uniref:Uncharacterized protein n=1 Tax=Coniochaeta ligniaria NRRL 30616 TaxID=1408157 RepID=A0A1J7JWN1_9PEZI|nr:hypothetical protein CONLIGDRAFT_688327 [Coniochaeta ligniaria NRRL 30616]
MVAAPIVPARSWGLYEDVWQADHHVWRPLKWSGTCLTGIALYYHSSTVMSLRDVCGQHNTAVCSDRGVESDKRVWPPYCNASSAFCPDSELAGNCPGLCVRYIPSVHDARLSVLPTVTPSVLESRGGAITSVVWERPPYLPTYNGQASGNQR